MPQSSDAIDPLRWLVYLLVGGPLLAWLFVTRQESLRLLIVLITLIFVQDALAGRRYVSAFSVAPSFMLVYVALFSQIVQRRIPRVGIFGPLWLGFLFLAAVGAVVGSLGTGLMLKNIDAYQVVYFEGFFFFLFGLVAVRRDVDLVLFLRQQATFIGLAIALIHFATTATGFRFRNADVTSTDVYYGGVFDNSNALAAYYVMLIPVALSMLARERLSSLWRFFTVIALIAMTGSLVLTGGRSGLIFTVGMCFIALTWSRIGLARGIAVIAAAGVLAFVGFEVMQSVVPDRWLDILGVAEEEGLQSNRFFLIQRYGLMMLQHPVGIGLSVPNFMTKIAEYDIPGVLSSHDIYIDMGLQTGILGLVLFVAMIGIVLIRNRRAFALSADHDQREALLYLFLLLLGYLSNGIFQPIFAVYPKLNNILWLLCGLSLAASDRAFAAHRATLRGERNAEPASLVSSAYAQRA